MKAIITVKFSPTGSSRECFIEGFDLLDITQKANRKYRYVTRIKIEAQ